MPTHKQDISELSVSQLATVPGRAAETIRKLLGEAGLQPARENGRTIWFTARQALPVILGCGSGLDGAAEKARLDSERADAQALKNAQARRELIPAAEIFGAWARKTLTWKAAVRALPSVAMVHAGITKEQALKLRALIDQTLVELADGKPPRRTVRRHRARKARP